MIHVSGCYERGEPIVEVEHASIIPDYFEVWAEGVYGHLEDRPSSTFEMMADTLQEIIDLLEYYGDDTMARSVETEYKRQLN